MFNFLDRKFFKNNNSFITTLTYSKLQKIILSNLKRHVLKRNLI